MASNQRIGPKEKAQKDRCTEIIKALQSHETSLSLNKLSTMSFGKEENSQWSHQEQRFLKTDSVIHPQKYLSFKDIQQLTSSLKSDKVSAKLLSRYSPKCHFATSQALINIHHHITPISPDDYKESLITKGKRIFFFWATWSPQSAYLLEEFMQNTKQHLFPTHQIITIAVEHTVEDANESVFSLDKAVHSIGTQFFIVSEQAKIIFQCSSVPQVYIVDEDETISFIGHPNLIHKMNDTNSSSQAEDLQSISADLFKSLTQYARGQFKQYISKNHWTLPCHFNLSLAKESTYNADTKTVKYARPVIQFDCQSGSQQSSIQAILDEIFSHFEEKDFDVRGNVQDESGVESDFVSFSEYLSENYTPKLQFCLKKATTLDCKTMKRTQIEEYGQSYDSFLDQVDAQLFGAFLKEEIDNFRNSQSQQNLDKFQRFFREGITYKISKDEQFLSVGQLQNFNNQEELIEIKPVVDASNKSQLLFFWAAWNEESMGELANIQLKLQTEAEKSDNSCVASSVCVDCDDDSIINSLKALSKFQNHYKISERNPHYSSLVHDYYNIPFIIIVNELNQISYSEPYLSSKLDTYITGLFDSSKSSFDEHKQQSFTGLEAFLEDNKEWLKLKAQKTDEMIVHFTKNEAIPCKNVDKFFDFSVKIVGKKDQLAGFVEEIALKVKETYTFVNDSHFDVKYLESHAIPINQTDLPLYFDLKSGVTLDRSSIESLRELKAWVLLIPAHSNQRSIDIDHKYVNDSASARDIQCCDMCQRNVKSLNSALWINLLNGPNLNICGDCLPTIIDSNQPSNKTQNKAPFMISV